MVKANKKGGETNNLVLPRLSKVGTKKINKEARAEQVVRLVELIKTAREIVKGLGK